MAKLNHEITEETGRIDKVLSQIFIDYTRTTIQDWLKENAVTVNGNFIKANYKVKRGDLVEITIPEEPEYQVEAEDIPLSILYEDDDLLVVNKPSGMVVHPSKGHHSGTLVNALLYHVEHLSSVEESFRPGIVHRIDKDTSGILVVAKNSATHLALSEQLATHDMERTYLALVEGRFENRTGRIEAPLARSNNNRLKREVVRTGKPAITNFEVLRTFTEHTLLKLKLETGRTHQIRAHMEFIGHPIVNDPMYHPKARQATIFGQFLHAYSLGFMHPRTKEWWLFEVDYPEEFAQKISEFEQEEKL